MADSSPVAVDSGSSDGETGSSVVEVDPVAKEDQSDDDSEADSEDVPELLTNSSDEDGSAMLLTSDEDEADDGDANPEIDYVKVNYTPLKLLVGDADDGGDDKGSEGDDEYEPPAKKPKGFRSSMPVTKEYYREVPMAGPRDPTLPDVGWDPDEVGMLEAFGVPRLLFYILAILFVRSEFDNSCNIDAVEYFSGKAQVTRNLALRGLVAVSFDILDDEVYQNINGILGWINALQILRRVKSATGLAWLGTVCSTWVFLSRDSTMRSQQDARGDRNRRCVRAGNRQAARSAAIIAIAYCRKLAWVLEQPGSSILWYHPAMLHCQHIALSLGLMWHHIETYMHFFEAKHLKKTVLCSNESWTQNLARGHPGHKGVRKHKSGPKTAVSSVRKSDGKKQTTGDKSGVLKGTQEYTAKFGFEVTESFLDFRNFFNDLDNTGGHIDSNSDSDSGSENVWEDLEISQVFEFLNSQHEVFDIREPRYQLASADP